MLPGGNYTTCMIYDMFPALDLYTYRSCTASPKGRLGYGPDDLVDRDLSDLSVRRVKRSPSSTTLSRNIMIV